MRRWAAGSVTTAVVLAAPATAVAMPADPPLPVHPATPDPGPARVTVVHQDGSDEVLPLALSGLALGVALAGAAYTVRLGHRRSTPA
jgi:hypothetical protein